MHSSSETDPPPGEARSSHGQTMEVIIRHPRPESWKHIKARTKFRLLLPFRWVEWNLSWGAHILSSWSFVSVLEYLGTLSLILVAVSYFTEASARLEQKHYQAWQVINTAQGKGGSGGRIEALQNLNDDHVPLVGVDLSKAFLQGMRLPHADLHRCMAEAGDWRDADLTGANLQWCVFTNSNFQHANFHAADLTRADFTDADLMYTNLSGVILNQTDFTRVDLRYADLRDWAHFETIVGIRKTNIFGIKNAPEGFAAWALANGAVAMEDTDAYYALLRQAPSDSATQPAKP